jgi:hypothetical protein
VTNNRLTPMSVVTAPVPTPPADRRPLVSVIIPCYNYARFLPESVGSSLSQEDVDVEVIVVDDASKDDSAAVASAFAAQDPRVRLVRHTTNTGHVVAFNDGYAEATGEFIVRLDADDLLTPGSLSRAVALFDAYPSVGLVYGHPNHFETETPPAPNLDLRGWTIWSGADWIAERCRKGFNCITTPEAIIRGSVMKSIGGLDTRLRFAQDMEMWLRTAAVSDVGHVDGPDQALHRDHATSMSVTDGAGELTDMTERRTVFEVLFEGPGGKLPGAAGMLETVRKQIASEAITRAYHAYDRGQAQQREKDIEIFIAFARETYADVESLPAWRALQWRQRIGPRLSPLTPPFVASAVLRRLKRDADYRDWVRTGV